MTLSTYKRRYRKLVPKGKRSLDLSPETLADLNALNAQFMADGGVAHPCLKCGLATYTPGPYRVYESCAYGAGCAPSDDEYSDDYGAEDIDWYEARNEQYA